jgi:hypothetical protein
MSKNTKPDVSVLPSRFRSITRGSAGSGGTAVPAASAAEFELELLGDPELPLSLEQSQLSGFEVQTLYHLYENQPMPTTLIPMATKPRRVATGINDIITAPPIPKPRKEPIDKGSFDFKFKQVQL